MATRRRICRDWRDLPDDLIRNIAKRLDSVDDYTHVRGVCESWRNAATLQDFNRSVTRIPLLFYEAKEVIHFEKAYALTKSIFKLHDLVLNKSWTIHNFPTDGVEFFSSCGWLLRVRQKQFLVDLIHPLSSVKIKLPKLDSFSKLKIRTRALSASTLACFIKKMILSGSPPVEGEDLLVMVIWGEEKWLGFCRPTDDSWTVLNSRRKRFDDIVYLNGKLYAIETKPTSIVEYDILGQNPKRSFRLSELDEVGVKWEKCYLVESVAKFVISLDVISQPFGYPGIRVFEMDVVNGKVSEITGMGKSRSMFLGCSSFVCPSVSMFKNFVPGSIYTHRKTIDWMHRLMRVGSFLEYPMYKNVAGLDWVLPTF